MSAASQSWAFQPAGSSPTLEAHAGGEEWFAVHVRARHEKVIDQRLRDNGISTFLPLVREVHGWSDRRKVVETPLFSCYVFARVLPRNDCRLRVLMVDGVLRFVGPGTQGIPIPEEQIEAVRKLVEEGLPYSSYPFLKIGQRVRIRSGALDGVEGVLISRSGERTLVVSVDAIQRSLAVRIEGYDLEPL